MAAKSNEERKTLVKFVAAMMTQALSARLAAS